MRVVIDQMKRLGWNYITQSDIDELNKGIRDFKIASITELRHFISQVSHECGCGKYLTEVWGPTQAQLTYEGRASLGNTQPGDGYKFRGAGYIQLTGRYNYTAFSKYMDDPKIVELGADYVGLNYRWLSAFFWWTNNNMSKLCATNPTVEAVTKRVNGGTNGLASRKSYYEKCCTIFTEESVAEPPPVVKPTTDEKSMPTLKKGSKNSNVKVLQNALNTKGFSCGKVDGIFGANTDKAVRAFQSKNKLTVDGIVGPKTWAALGF